MDRYLSYLSSPPLLHYYSSLWSPVEQKGFRQKEIWMEREDEWIERGRIKLDIGGKEKGQGYFFFFFFLERINKLDMSTKTWSETDGLVDDLLPPPPGAQTSQDSIEGEQNRGSV